MSTSRGAATSPTSRWWPPILWAGLILGLTSWPNPGVDVGVAGADKLVHFSLYAVLGALVARALAAPRARRGLVLAAAQLMLFGALDEWHQQFVPGRSAELADWVADLLGALVGLLAAHHLLPLAHSRQDIST